MRLKFLKGVKYNLSNIASHRCIQFIPNHQLMGGGGKLDVIHFNKFNEIEIIDCGALYKYY